MAPLFHLLALAALSLAVLASPHVSRNVYDHAHRAVAVPHAVGIDSSSPLPRRQRSLNKRCIPRPTNSTLPSSTPSSPNNVGSVPSGSPPPSADTSTPPTDQSSPTPPPATTPTTTPTPPPATTSTPPPATTSTPPPAATPTTSSTPPPAQPSSPTSGGNEPSYLQGTQHGEGTFYAPGLGACGITNTATDYIAAVSESLFDSYPNYNGVNPNTNPVCNKQITVNYGGKTATVTVTDRCTGCQTTDLDFSPAVFDSLADPAIGRIDITWTWA